MHNWEFLGKLANDLTASGKHDLPDGIETILSDRLLSALSSEEREDIDLAADELEKFYLRRLADAPESASNAARGEGDPASSDAASFALGQLGLAHAVVAYAASKRADARFERIVTSRQFESYIRLLLETELSGRELADRIEKDPAEVSRRLKVLRQIGAIEHRRDGNRVMNFLTPAARAVAKDRNMGPKGSARAPQIAPKVAEALDRQRKDLDPHLQELPNFGTFGLAMAR